jgi:hypothetical protein
MSPPNSPPDRIRSVPEEPEATASPKSTGGIQPEAHGSLRPPLDNEPVDYEKAAEGFFESPHREDELVERLQAAGPEVLKKALCRSVWNLTSHPMLCQAR